YKSETRTRARLFFSCGTRILGACPTKPGNNRSQRIFRHHLAGKILPTKNFVRPRKALSTPCRLCYSLESGDDPNVQSLALGRTFVSRWNRAFVGAAGQTHATRTFPATLLHISD